MTHLDEGTLVAVRDGTIGAGEVTRHVRDCDTCGDALEESRTRSRHIAEALASLDEPFDVAGAKASVRRRLDRRRGTDRIAPGRLRRHLGRAAAILLVSAGAASALPWSPLHRWWSSAEPATTSGGAQLEPPVATPPNSTLPGIAVDVPPGGVSVTVRGAAPGSAIDVVWISDAVARVSAPTGSTFAYADGRIEVVAGPGALRVELPAGASRASLEVDGRLFLERSGGGLAVPGPAEVVGEDAVRFLVPLR